MQQNEAAAERKFTLAFVLLLISNESLALEESELGTKIDHRHNYTLCLKIVSQRVTNMATMRSIGIRCDKFNVCRMCTEVPLISSSHKEGE
jgi:hypothetical protein